MPDETRLYHALSAEMQGSALVPLRELRQVDPAAYTRAMAKYDDHPDRKRIPVRPISLLDCQWQDVVQCCPIHPHLLWRAWRDVGVERESKRFVEIPRSLVAHLEAVTFDRDGGGEEVYTPVDWSTFRNVTEVSEATRAWYAKLAAMSRKGADFIGVPHVMIRGSIDIANLPVIDWSTSNEEDAP